MLLLTLVFSYLKEEKIIFFNKSIQGLFVVSSVILLTEMILRSSGKPWLFLLYGARKGYAGTSGDLTAGFGEPVTMGLFASFFIFYFLFFYKSKLMVFYTALIMLLSIAKSAFLTFFTIFSIIYVKNRNLFWNYISYKYVIIISVISIPLVGMVIKRLLGTGDSDTITTISIGSIQISSDVNLIRNISSAISWADPYLDVEWYYQFLLLPLVGGIENVIYIEKSPFIFFLGIIYIYLIVYYFVIKGNFYTKTSSSVLLLIFSYYGGFMGNPYAFYYLSDKTSTLGYVPRNEPYYLFFFILLSYILSKEIIKKR
jgi:hypothetical protein